MIYYLIFFSLALLSFITEAKLPRGLLILITSILTVGLVIFAGLRGDIEGDYSSYLDIFKHSSVPYSASAGVEPGYYYLNHYIYNLGYSFPAVVFIMAVFSIVPKIIFFNKYSSNIAFTLLIYYCSTFFYFDFIQIRQAVTIGIFMCCLPYINQRKLGPYLFFILIASLIHISVLILIPVYFVAHKNFSKFILYSILAACALVTFLKFSIPLIDLILGGISMPGFTDGKVTAYQNSELFSAVSYKQLIIASLFIFIKDKFDDNKALINVLVNCFIIGILLATVFNQFSEVSFRIKWYFLWTEAMLMYYVVKYFAKQSLTLTYLMYVCLFILYLYSLNTLLLDLADRDRSFIFPYKFYFQL